MRRLAVILFFLGLASLQPAFAVTPDEMLKDPALEARARALSAELRCLVCQNQSIDDSEAPLAHDLRVLLRERLTAGDTDRQAIDFLVARYGPFILLKPPFTIDTVLLWGTPLAVLVIGGVGIFFAARRRRNTVEAAELTGEERNRVAGIIARDPAANLPAEDMQAAPEAASPSAGEAPATMA